MELSWNNKRVLILGFGEEGRANLHFARKCGATAIAIADQSPNLSLKDDEAALVNNTYTGESWLSGCADYDIILRSPGVSLRHIAQIRRDRPDIVITSGTDIFLGLCGNKTIGVTATKGKSTTSSLIHSILIHAGYNSKLGGNIGLPALKLLDETASIYVLELSSYQLADVTHSPDTAVFLNLFPEHLDHHGDFQSYGEAKANISRFQNPTGRLIIPYQFTAINSLTAGHRGDKIIWGHPTGRAWITDNAYYYRDTHGIAHRICDIDETNLKGPGNQRNIQAALAALSHLNISSDILARAIIDFSPLPHRLEHVGTVNGVTFINDSISTVPEATINALETFGDAVKTVILGGYDRGVSFDSLADYLLTQTKTQNIILFPPSGARIAKALTSHPKFSELGVRLVEVSQMKDAVTKAKELTPSGAICLLSPASPSFPIFKNFEERGAVFRGEVLRES